MQFYSWVRKIYWRRDRLPTPVLLGFPCGSAGKESACSAGPGFHPWVGKIPWRRERLPTPVFWPGELHGLYNSWGSKESDTTEQLSLSTDPSLESYMSPCHSIKWLSINSFSCLCLSCLLLSRKSSENPSQNTFFFLFQILILCWKGQKKHHLATYFRIQPRKRILFFFLPRNNL